MPYDMEMDEIREEKAAAAEKAAVKRAEIRAEIRAVLEGKTEEGLKIYPNAPVFTEPLPEVKGPDVNAAIDAACKGCTRFCNWPDCRTLK